MADKKPPIFKKLEREPLWNRAREQLKDALLAGRFEPGSVLTLRALADMFGTSITPVRDAVNHLVARGVLEQGARNSAVVPDVGVSLLDELTIVRTELEGRAAFEAASRATPEDVGAVENQLALMLDLIAKHDLETYLDAHRKFHFTIYRVADKPVLYDIIENLWLRCGPILTHVIPVYVPSLKGTDHHRTILEAIRSGDGPLARAEIAADIQDAARYLRRCAEQNGTIRRPATA